MTTLGLLLVLPAFLVLATCQADLQLTAEPSNVVNGTTEQLQLTCRAPAVDDSVNLIVLLQLDQLSDDVATPMASQRTTGTLLHSQDGRLTAEGALNGGAYLTLTVTSPEVNDTGRYQCRFAYLDMALFKLVVLNSTVTVTFTEPDEPTPPPPPSSCSCDQMWEEVKDLRETVIAENRELRQQLKSYNDSCRVSFTAQLKDPNGVYFMSNMPVVFDSVVSNKGEAYDVSKGIFTAPCSGQYFLRLSMRTQQEDDSGYVDGAIEVNGEERARTSVFTVDMDHFEQASNGVVVGLAEGDEVQVRIQTNSAGRIYGGAFTTFTGFFISA